MPRFKLMTVQVGLKGVARQRAPYIPTEMDRIRSYMDIYHCLLVFGRFKPQNPFHKNLKNSES
jgi:hypothetical protein